MNFRPVTKLDKINKKASEQFRDDVISASCDFISIFSIYSQFGAIQMPDYAGIVSKTYTFINRNLLPFTKLEIELKNL